MGHSFIFRMAIPGLFFFNFVLSTVNGKHVHFKILPMAGFEWRTSGIGSDRSANWATTASPSLFYSYSSLPSTTHSCSTASRIRLRLPSSSPGFESKAHYGRFYSPNFVLQLSFCWEKDENKQKEAGFGPYFKKHISLSRNLNLKYERNLTSVRSQISLSLSMNQSRVKKSISKMFILEENWRKKRWRRPDVKSRFHRNVFGHY